MYRLSAMYEQYSSTNTAQQSKLRNNIKQHQDTMKALQVIIHPYADEIREHSDLEIQRKVYKKLDKIVTIKEKVVIPEIINFSIFRSTMNVDLKMRLISIMTSHNTLKNEIIKLTLKKVEHKREIVNRQKHDFIIKRFNYLILDKIIEGGKLHLGDGSAILIKAKRRKYDKKLVNWHESNEFKRQLLAEGLVPYKATKDEEGVIIGSNGGIPWLHYFTDPIRTMIHWEANRCITTNSHKYRFSPTCKSTHGVVLNGRFVESEKRNFVKRLREYEREHPDYLTMIMEKNN